MREVVLDSGAILRVNPAPFSEAKALFEAVMAEMRVIPVTYNSDQISVFKDLFCMGFSSPLVDKRLWTCLARCTYDAEGTGANAKITMDAFEPEKNRADYVRVCAEVAEENLRPFLKDLSFLLKRVSDMIEKVRPSKSPKTSMTT